LDTEEGWVDMHGDLKKILESFEDLKSIPYQIHQIMKGKVPIVPVLRVLTRPNPDDERVKFLQWISRIRYTDHHETNFKDVLPGTGQWLLEDPLFSDWMQSGSVLWLHGIREFIHP
jgi:hypothetical protein